MTIQPTLYIFSGLPGVGKTTLAKKLATHLGATYLRADTIEQGLRELCDMKVQGEGYRLSYRIARDNLLLGNHVVTDSCNPIELTRREWKEVALGANARCVNIEICCSDIVEHRCRVESRETDITGLVLPTWEQVQLRHYTPWPGGVIRIDTAGITHEEAFQQLIQAINS